MIQIVDIGKGKMSCALLLYQVRSLISVDTVQNILCMCFFGRHLFLRVLEAGKYKIKVAAWFGSGEGLLSVANSILLAIFPRG
jgi:hypothetical protein